MKRRARRTILIVLSVLVCCMVFCGIACAATILSPEDGATFSSGAINIQVKTGYSSNRQDYCEISVYDESGTLVQRNQFEYDGTQTVIKDSYLPEETGKYTIKAVTYYYVQNYYLINGRQQTQNIRSNSGKSAETTVNYVNTSQVTSAKPVVTAVTNNSGKVTLSIDGNVSKYTIYRATSKDGSYSKIGTTSKATYVDKTAGQKTYYYKVRGSATIGGKTYNTKYSSTVKVNARISAHKAEIAVELDADDNAVITVVTKPKASGYKYYRSDSIDGKYKLLKTTSKASYTDTTAGDGTYYYKVLPYANVNDKKVTGKYSEAVEFTKNNPNKPGKPEITVTQAYYEDGSLAENCFTVNFNKVANADTYKLYVSKDGGKTYSYDKSGWYIMKDTDFESDYAKWWQRENTPGTYYYKLAASSENYQNGEYEAFSDPVSFTIPESY